MTGLGRGHSLLYYEHISVLVSLCLWTGSLTSVFLPHPGFERSSGLEVAISLFLCEQLRTDCSSIFFLSLSELGSDKTPAGQALVNCFPLRAGFVEKNKVLCPVSK